MLRASREGAHCMLYLNVVLEYLWTHDGFPSAVHTAQKHAEEHGGCTEASDGNCLDKT